MLTSMMPLHNSLYEFTVASRSLFAADGLMLHCSCRSTLMHILEERGAEKNTSTTGSTALVKVAIADGKAEVQSLDKVVWVNICKDLAENFTTCIF